MLERTLPDFESLDFNDSDVVADVVERFNKLAARHSHGQHDIKQLPEAMGLPGQLGPKIIQNGKAMHLFSPDIFSDLVADGKCTTWSPGTAVVTEDGRKGTIVLFDAVGELYSVRLGAARRWQRASLQTFATSARPYAQRSRQEDDRRDPYL